MPKKSKKGLDDDEIIIGYNSRNKKDKPPQKRNYKPNNKKQNKINSRKKKSKWKKIKKVLMFILKTILILGILVGIGAFLFVSPVFNITEIKVENASKISENTYIALSEIELGENIFRISKSQIIEKIKTESYVEDVEIKREYPGTILISVTERTPSYMVEKNGGMYAYIDKNGYYLEASTEKLELPIINGLETDIEELEVGSRISEEDLSKFNDIIKIIDALNNNEIETSQLVIDISDAKNYVLEFSTENKKVIIGDTTDLSTKMLWIKYFMEKSESEAGTIHLSDIQNVYFEPNE